MLYSVVFTSRRPPVIVLWKGSQIRDRGEEEQKKGAASLEPAAAPHSKNRR